MKKTLRKIMARLVSIDLFITVVAMVIAGTMLVNFGKGVVKGYKAAQLVAAQPFRIKPLDKVPPAWTPSSNAWTMVLPPEGGFAPNVIVQTQDIGEMSMAEYRQLSLVQMTEFKPKVILDKVQGNSWTVEYTGSYGGKAFHWYQRVVLAGGKAYLATGAAKPAQWAKHGARLKACVDTLTPKTGLDPMQGDLQKVQD